MEPPDIGCAPSGALVRRYTVTALTHELDRLLHRAFPRVCVEGELSQVSTPASGHAYLTLRDGETTLQVVMWRSDWQRLKVPPTAGQRVACFGRLGLYPGQGRYQLYANRLEPVGQGELQQRLAAIKRRLDEDGLLDPRRKRPLPKAPSVVGLATSPTGAALQDFLRVSKQRWPAARILVAGCKVQGPEAAASVVRALELLFEDGRSDVIVVTRGGGSALDLIAFADEQLARWIATAPVPVVSAVGHEIDTSIADLVADAVAPTPSAAAMLVLPDGSSRTQRVDEAQQALTLRMQRVLAQRRERLSGLARRLRHPARRLQHTRERHTSLAQRLHGAWARTLQRRRERLAALVGRLEALSPYGVLGRGYAIVRGPGGIVRAASDVEPDDALQIRLADGEVRAKVTE
ncbi:MAG: exodeoxyribonuclease VII large subunit [Myxococcales bacterium]|nr:exodeoxyribonuclease VII large subunit [Myxococcales bacterium]